MKISDLWLAWAAMVALALFGMVMAGPARAQHWRGGMRGPVMARPMVGGGGAWHGYPWHGGGYPYIHQRPWYPGAGIAAGIVGGLAAGAMAQQYYGNPCWRWDQIYGWMRVC